MGIWTFVLLKVDTFLDLLIWLELFRPFCGHKKNPTNIDKNPNVLLLQHLNEFIVSPNS